MEQLRKLIMECLAEFFDECPGDDESCPRVADSESAILAIIQGIREELAATKVTLRDYKKAYQDLEKKIAELEKTKMFVPIPEPIDPLPYKTGDGWKIEPPFIFTCQRL